MIGKLQRSTVIKSQGTNMMNKQGWITNTKSGQRPDPFMESKNLNEEGCLQWRCTLWKPLSRQPLEKTLWIKAKDFSDYSQGLNHWCYFLNNNQWCFTREKKGFAIDIFHIFEESTIHWNLSQTFRTDQWNWLKITTLAAFCLKITTLAAFFSCSSFRM